MENVLLNLQKWFSELIDLENTRQANSEIYDKLTKKIDALAAVDRYYDTDDKIQYYINESAYNLSKIRVAYEALTTSRQSLGTHCASIPKGPSFRIKDIKGTLKVFRDVAFVHILIYSGGGQFIPHMKIRYLFTEEIRKWNELMN